MKNIERDNLPNHIAVIMDGNGRWARQRGAERVFGHQNAIKAVRDVTEGCAELGIKYLTLYAFSTENWNRPKREIDALMKLMVSTIKNETDTLMKNKVKLTAIGDIDSLPGSCQQELKESMDLTKNNDGLTLVLALSYSGRWEIIEAVKKLISEVKNDRISVAEIDNQKFAEYLQTSDMPDPELLIRTSGEMRISNFLLWQIFSFRI